MRKMSDCLQLDIEPLPKPKSLDKKTKEIVDGLFIVLQVIFPAFKQAWPTQNEFNMAKREWIKAFMHANLNDLNKIQEGVKKFRMLELPFVPSPGQFIAMCKTGNHPPFTSRFDNLLETPLTQQEIESRAKGDAMFKRLGLKL